MLRFEFESLRTQSGGFSDLGFVGLGLFFGLEVEGCEKGGF